MIIALHCLSTKYCNTRTDIRIAGETGYQGLEMSSDKLLRYIDAGYTAEDLQPLLQARGLQVVSINDVLGVEQVDDQARAAMLAYAERLIAAAAALHCPTIQLVPLCALEGRPWREIIKLTARNVAEVADMGKQRGVRFKLEPVAWSPIHSLARNLELIAEVGRDNVGTTIDFWHLSAGEETTPDDVAKLPASLIYGIHVSDGILHTAGTEWDENVLRGYLPGEGRIPIKEWAAAVQATGYDGVWACEILSYKHWEWDLFDLARDLKRRLLAYV